LAIKVNKNKSLFNGGEFIKFKDNKSYGNFAFKYHIPTGKKEISKVITSEKSSIFNQMEEAGDDIYSLPVRDVYYLVRGKNKGHIKVCLVNGAFFETVSVENLISS